MFKIIELHPASSASAEYVVLQNHSTAIVSLRGWAICTDRYLLGDPIAAARTMYIFTDEIGIKPYQRVVLFSGAGETGWYPTVDDKLAYVAYWGREEPAWSDADRVLLLQLASTRRVVVPDTSPTTSRRSPAPTD